MQENNYLFVDVISSNILQMWDFNTCEKTTFELHCSYEMEGGLDARQLRIWKVTVVVYCMILSWTE